MLISRDRLSSQVAEFSKQEDELENQLTKAEELFGDDEPILGFEEIHETLDDAEDRLTSNIIGSVWSQTQKWMKTIAPDLNKLDEDAIERSPLNLAPTIQGLLINGWREIFNIGSRAGIAELNELGIEQKEKSPSGVFNHGCIDTLVQFDRVRRRDDSLTDNVGDSNGNPLFGNITQFNSSDKSGVDKYIKRKPAFEVAYPPDRAELDVIEVDELKEALNLRTQILAEDLSQDVSDRISRVIKDSIDLHYVKGREVQRLPKASRRKIVQQINGIINYERQKQISEGVDSSDAPSTRIAVGGNSSSGFVSRTKMIASTELNAGYNLGRLQTYHRTGVTHVRWQTISDRRTCKICRTRNGLVLKLSTVLKTGLRFATTGDRKVKYKQFQFVIPAHPFCRCAWQVARKDEIKDKKRAVGAVIKKTTPLAKAWGVSAGAVGLASNIGKAKKAVLAADRLVKEQQLQESSKRKARNRALLVAGGALSLSALSIGLWTWLNKKPAASSLSPGKSSSIGKVGEAIQAIASEEAQEKAIASAITKSQSQLLAAKIQRETALAKRPLTPVQLMRGRNPTELGWNQMKQQKYKEFLSSQVDLKTISDTQLRIQFGLLAQDIATIRKLQRETERNMVKLSPYQKMLPAAVVSPPTIAKYPWLAEIKDIRELTLDQLLKRGIPKEEANHIYTAVYRKARSTAGLARRSKEERKVLQTINKVKSVEELQGILNLTRKERDTAQRLFEILLALKAKGDVGFDNLAQIRIFGIGDKTVARMLSEADSGPLKINVLPIATDRQMAETILQERISGVGPKMAAAIYDALMDTGTQFSDAKEMYERILPYLRMRGVAIADDNKLRKNLERLDFTYLPGMDLQPIQNLPGEGNLPALPAGDRRGDLPRLPGDDGLELAKSEVRSQKSEGTTSLQPLRTSSSVTQSINEGQRLKRTSQAEGKLLTSDSSLLTPIVEPMNKAVLVPPSGKPSIPEEKVRAQRIRSRNQTQSNIDNATEEVVGLNNTFNQTFNSEIKNSKAKFYHSQTIGERLIEGEKKVSQVTQRNINEVRKTQHRLAKSLVENIDRAVDNLEEDLKLGIENPLSSQSYSVNGKLTPLYKKRIDESIKQIDEQIRQINATRDLSRSDRNELSSLKKKLETLKKEANAVSNSLVAKPSRSTIEQQRTLQRAKELAQELEALPDDSIAKDYPIDERLNTIREIKRSSLRPDNTVIEEIDNLIQQLDDAPAQIINNSESAIALKNEKLKQRLIEQREKLTGIRDRTLTVKQKTTNIATNKQRELIARQQREFKTLLENFDKEFNSFDKTIGEIDGDINTNVLLTKPESLESTRASSILQSEKNIAGHINRLKESQRSVDILKSDYWQDYASSLADSEKTISFGEDSVVDFGQLVAIRNKAIRKAARSANKSARQVKAWSYNPQSLVLDRQQKVTVLQQKVEQLVQQQRKLDSQSRELIELASADPSADYSDLIKRINDRASSHRQKLNDYRSSLTQAQNNLNDILNTRYDLQIGESERRTPNEIDSLTDKIVARTKKKIAKKDRNQVTSIFNFLDAVGLDSDDFIRATKQGKYTQVQQDFYNSLSDKQRRSLNTAIEKNVLDLNQDSRILRNSRTLLYSISRSLKQEQTAIFIDIAKSIPIRGARQARIAERIETALKSDNIEEALNAASELQPKLFQQVEPLLRRYGEIVGDKFKVSSSEVNTLAGVKPEGIGREQFINQVKGNLALADEGNYSLSEINKAIKLNTSAIANIEQRLSAANFRNKNNLMEFSMNSKREAQRKRRYRNGRAALGLAAGYNIASAIRDGRGGMPRKILGTSQKQRSIAINSAAIAGGILALRNLPKKKRRRS